MARIDRLPEGAKSVLQIGAVMGREWRETLLREVAGLAEQDLLVHLAALTDAELSTRGACHRRRPISSSTLLRRMQPTVACSRPGARNSITAWP